MKPPDQPVTDRIRGQRPRHRQRPLIIRGALLVFGALLAMGGAVIIIPVPELGAPALLTGLGFLALEFDWALRWLSSVERWIRTIFVKLRPGKR